MMRQTAVFLLFFALVVQPTARAENSWQPLNKGISDLDIRSISVFPADDKFVCAASEKQVYLSSTSGSLWKEIFSLKPKDEKINFVLFDSSRPQIIYLAGTKGFFATNNQGKNWQRLFSKVSEAANKVNCIALDPSDSKKIYLGTGDGLYLSSGSGKNWRKIKAGLPRAEVVSVAVHPSNSQVIYLANKLGLFKSINSGRTWKRIYVSSYKVSDEENQDETESKEKQNLINWIAIDKAKPKNIFIATGRGVFSSSDAGEQWSRLFSGLSSNYINFVLCANREDAVYAATEDGLFEFSAHLNRWQNIYSGMTAHKVRCLALNADENQLFAGTNKGIFRIVKTSLAQRHNKAVEQVIKEIVQSEPTIRDVQEAAVKYAEVIDPERIKTLRRDAKLKALLPDVSLDYDKTINYDSGADRYYVGPYDWGFTFSWDIGDLVFNEQVRLIDSNTRLMVQLRDDILTEVTRLYYERRSLQTELILNPPKTSKLKLSQALRLEELTANIDALTGGYFSKQIKE